MFVTLVPAVSNESIPQAQIRRVFRNGYFSRSSSNTFSATGWFTATVTGTEAFSSSLASELTAGTTSGGHHAWSLSHSGPCCHKMLLVTFPPRLPRSAGFHLIRSFSLIFLTRLDTNCQYSPCPFIQYRTTVECSQQ